MSSSYGSTYEGHVPRNKGRIRAVENMQSETIKETKVTNNPQRQTKQIQQLKDALLEACEENERLRGKIIELQALLAAAHDHFDSTQSRCLDNMCSAEPNMQKIKERRSRSV